MTLVGSLFTASLKQEHGANLMEMYLDTHVFKVAEHSFQEPLPNSPLL